MLLSACKKSLKPHRCEGRNRNFHIRARLPDVLRKRYPSFHPLVHPVIDHVIGFQQDEDYLCAGSCAAGYSFASRTDTESESHTLRSLLDVDVRS